MIAVVESLSAEYLGCLGSKEGLTPNLDRLARESLLFTDLYATGTRTARGIEAIVLSIPPMPGYGGIKRPDLGRVFCLPHLFQERGYDFAFLYSGYSYFDNFKNFFTAQGCRVVDRNDLGAGEITFATIWGVCDGDIYRRAVKEADAAYARKMPFCYLVDTCSNHRPYTYPQEIDIPSGSGRPGAVKYADHAIGQLLGEARRRPWFDDTIFLVIADHCANSAGKTDLPYDRYHIPMLIYAPKIVPPGRCDWLASQIDVGPTLLGLLNFSYSSKFFGQDVLRAPPHRAFIGTYQKLGLLTDGKLGVLSVGRRFDTYQIMASHVQRPAEPDEELLEDAASYYQAANWLLKNHAYR
jgi:phosphoglycerol transferase MdoB-like AlkP superfamily enzyme